MHNLDALPPHLFLSRNWSGRELGLFKRESGRQSMRVSRAGTHLGRAPSLAWKGFRALGALPQGLSPSCPAKAGFRHVTSLPLLPVSETAA